MNNKKYYPFERNNYFYGKLLTVRDFYDEQKYMNDKRRINNILTNGAGVLCGMNVVLIDDKTISVESGIALDYQGREIVIDESFTKKLHVIDGFDNLDKNEYAYLCLKYNEDKKESVYKVGEGQNNEDLDFNRISENFKIYITNEVNEKNLLWLQNLKISKEVIFNKSGVKITQTTPKYVKANENFEIRVTIEKKDINQSIIVDYMIYSEFLKNEENLHYTRVYFDSNKVSPTKKVVLTFNMTAFGTGEFESKVSMKSNESQINIENEKFNFSNDINIPFYVIDKEPKRAVIEKYMTMHLDDVVKKNMEEPIYIAKLHIVKSKNEYGIVDLQYLPFKQFVLSNQMIYNLLDINNERKQIVTVNNNRINEIKQENNTVNKPSFSCGTEEITIDLRCKNKVYFSDEISHGLNLGDVQIDVAVHEPAKEETMFEQDCTYFGNMSILNGSIFESSMVKVETAVISYPKRGTFRIAVKPMENSESNVIRVKWWARNYGADKTNKYLDIDNISISINPDIINLRPMEKYKFNVEIKGAENKECYWEISEPNGGIIDINGVYEAPAHEGVYEIVAKSVKYPNKKVTAFVVVREG